MNSSTIKLLIAGVLLLLFLSACVPYHQVYYPAGGAYSSYGGSQRYDYGGHPYSNNHNNHHQPDHHDGYHSRPSWNNGYGNDNHNRYENHEQAHDQRERHHRGHYH